jgi:hypothetical protein
MKNTMEQQIENFEKSTGLKLTPSKGQNLVWSKELYNGDSSAQYYTIYRKDNRVFLAYMDGAWSFYECDELHSSNNLRDLVGIILETL